MAEIAIRISRPIDDPRWLPRRNSIELNQARFEDATNPIVIEEVGGRWSIRCAHRALALADSSVDRIEIQGVFELVRDDRALFHELARVLKPGGVLKLRVPNAGPTAGLDSLNLYRYLADVLKRGVRIPDVEEVGFRRHFSSEDVARVLGESFEIGRRWTTGTGISELAHVGLLATLTLPNSNAGRYLVVRPALLSLVRIDEMIPAPGIGFWLWIEARKA